MVAYLEKTDGNTEFHQIMDFLTRSSIYYALTVSPIVSTSFVEQFWTTAKSRTVNNISYIDATVAGKPVTISEASIRSDLLFDDADGIDSLNNQAIFDNIQLMGYEGDLNTLTFNKALFSPQWKFLFHTMNHCISSKSTSWDQIPTNIATAVSAQAKEIKALKAQGRKSVKSSKGEPFVYKDPAFDDLDDDAMDYMESKDAQDEGRTSYVVLEEKESADKEVSTKAPVSTVKPNEGTDKRNKGKNATQTASTTTSNHYSNNIGEDETIATVLITIEFVLTLKPLPKIDPKDKGKNMIDEEGESDTESDDITEAEKKFKMLAKDEEVARKVQEEWEAEGEKKRLAEGEKKRLAEEEATKVLYERLKRQDQNFVAIRSAEDERQIKELNKDPKKKRVIKETLREEDTAKVPAEQEVTKQGTKKRKSGHVKMIARKRPRPQPDDDSDDEHIKCLRIITFDSTIDSEIMETKSFIARLHKVSSPDGNYLVVYRVNGHFRAFNYLMEVLHIFDRQDLFHLYDLVMKQYSKITPEDIELILWGDLKIMMESSTKENDPRRSLLSKELLQRMLDLGLEVEEESTAALQLVRFIKQQLNEE
ncbi:hypothetical protein Tco_0184571 [Tanacetum coccineum]